MEQHTSIDDVTDSMEDVRICEDLLVLNPEPEVETETETLGVNLPMNLGDLDDLVGVSVKSDEDAYELYNAYAFRIGFSIRRHKQTYRGTSGDIATKIFCCNRAGKKTRVEGRKYSKIDTRCGCKADVQFNVDEDGLWTVVRHNKIHNHDLITEDKAHHLRSQRNVSNNQLLYLKHLKDSGVSVATGIRLLKKQSGGSPFVGFVPRDAYNVLAQEKSKTLDGSDSNALIEIFRKRQSNEKDFYFDFEVDIDGRLCSFFWRDARMKQDYELFGDLLVHDTTYRTNRYDMICAPFVGMNHHCLNVMFGCGFVLNERMESFVWLFKTFLKSMGGNCPQTIMTDQCPSMAAAIPQVFPSSRHRLCTWHISENAKKNVKSLIAKKGFMDSLQFLLKETDSEAEFEKYWIKFEKDYDCRDNEWIQKLFDIREKWCPAFNKDVFSGGVLSSQRSESTNHAVSRRLFRTAGLCDFYHTFCDVVSEWRSKENGEDYNCLKGVPTMALEDVNLLCHARDIYTVEMYKMFEQQYKKGCACQQGRLPSEDGLLKFHLGRVKDIIRHHVTFDRANLIISCTCNLFTEVGILCCHCLRIMDVYNIEKIPERYIVKRWTKGLVAREKVCIEDSTTPSEVGLASSIWRIQMIRNFNQLVSASELNVNARKHCEEAFNTAKNKVSEEVGAFYTEHETVASSSSDGKIQNPVSTRKKGSRNVRAKSVISKKAKQTLSRRKMLSYFHQDQRIVYKLLSLRSCWLKVFQVDT